MRAPLFLARAVYRRRRLRDAARLLPFVGVLLLLLPALGQSTGRGTEHVIYVFVVWALLIAAAAILAPGLAAPESDQPPAQSAEDDD